MNTFELKCFLAVADFLNFARAAERLNVTQPTVTHQIKALEDELGAKLFRRSTRIVELTAEGLAFIPDAKNMLAIEQEAKLRYSSRAERKIDAISIGCSNYAQFELLTEILHTLDGMYSNFHPKLFVLPPEQLFHLLETESVDVILSARESGKMREKLRYRELSSTPLTGVCRRDYFQPLREHITVDELKSEKVILCAPAVFSAEAARLQQQLAAQKNPAELHFCPSAEASYILASAGMGVAILPKLLIPDNPRVATIRIINAPALSFGLFYHSYSESAVLKSFIQAAEAYFSHQRLK